MPLLMVRCCQEMPCASTAVIRGDTRSLSIAGASIIAKHSRDLIMKALILTGPHMGGAKITAMAPASINKHWKNMAYPRITAAVLHQ